MTLKDIPGFENCEPFPNMNPKEPTQIFDSEKPFTEQFLKGKYWEIDVNITPELISRGTSLYFLKLLYSYALEAQNKEIEQEAKNIRLKFHKKFKHLEKSIKILEAIDFLEENQKENKSYELKVNRCMTNQKN